MEEDEVIVDVYVELQMSTIQCGEYSPYWNLCIKNIGNCSALNLKLRYENYVRDTGVFLYELSPKDGECIVTFTFPKRKRRRYDFCILYEDELGYHDVRYGEVYRVF